ncbi:hypothetical protein M378DRAFT_57305, partial [Amanita muscaria Koide BX008]
RDEVGMVRAICVKARSSSQRKELFKEIQQRKGLDPLQLLIDMKVRWGSTYAMLNRTDVRKEAINTFLYELGTKENDLEKRKKIDALALREPEWERVKQFCNLLVHADKAQQAFSSATAPSLHNALPVIEALHAAWSSRAEKTRYAPFKDGLLAAAEKLDGYYQKTAESDAHIFAMVLHPGKKLSHFTKYWTSVNEEEITSVLKKKFEEHYKCVRSNNTASSASDRYAGQVKPTQRKGLLRDNPQTDSEAEDDMVSTTFNNTTEPWMAEFNQYLKTVEAIADDVDIVSWWGLNAPRYPTWASLARDYLAVMASSVSSERAFSSAGITISKRRNQLKGDIVEALQCMKVVYSSDLLFCEVVVTKELEKELEDLDPYIPGDDGGENSDDAEGFSWDQLIASDDNDDD